MRRNPFALILILVVAYQAISGGLASSPREWLMDTLVILPGIIIGLAFHEFGHAFVSHRLGDPTPKAQGRVTINPIAHLDPVGFICLLFIHFGWGKPVMIDPRYYKHPRRDELLVSVAGVLMNLILAIIFMAVLKLLVNFVIPSLSYDGAMLLLRVFQNVVFYNIVLMIFNLLPIPPLDGFNIITQIFNLRRTQFYYKIYDKGFLILMILILFNLLEKILWPPIFGIYNGLVGLFF